MTKEAADQACNSWDSAKVKLTALQTRSLASRYLMLTTEAIAVLLPEEEWTRSGRGVGVTPPMKRATAGMGRGM